MLHSPAFRTCIYAFYQVSLVSSLALGWSGVTRAQSLDLSLAPKSFAVPGGKAVFVDFSNSHIKLTFDTSKQIATGIAEITFSQAENGFPLIDLVPEATKITLDGKTLAPSLYSIIETPDQSTRFRVLKENTEKDVVHHIVIEYRLDEGVSFENSNAARASFFTDDLSDRGFWEQYVPSNLEYDQFEQSIDLEVVGTKLPHELFVNGDIQEVSANHWQVHYPAYFNTSSAYLHLTEKGRFAVEKSTVKGINGDIQLTTYATQSSLAKSGMKSLKENIKELEDTFGPFAHKNFVAYMTPGGGGMEYCGATVTSLTALGHETAHSWFARGVMPGNGNSGWIDEAIVSWRDDGYPSKKDSFRSPSALGGFSQYRRHTHSNAYGYGKDIISEFNKVFQDERGSSMKATLKEFFSEYHNKIFTNDIFESFLSTHLKRSLNDFFKKFVYVADKGSESGIAEPTAVADHHPRPFTKAERDQLR